MPWLDRENALYLASPVEIGSIFETNVPCFYSVMHFSEPTLTLRATSADYFSGLTINANEIIMQQYPAKKMEQGNKNTPQQQMQHIEVNRNFSASPPQSSGAGFSPLNNLRSTLADMSKSQQHMGMDTDRELIQLLQKLLKLIMQLLGKSESSSSFTGNQSFSNGASPLIQNQPEEVRNEEEMPMLLQQETARKQLQKNLKELDITASLSPDDAGSSEMEPLQTPAVSDDLSGADLTDEPQPYDNNFGQRSLSPGSETIAEEENTESVGFAEELEEAPDAPRGKSDDGAKKLAEPDAEKKYSTRDWNGRSVAPFFAVPDKTTNHFKKLYKKLHSMLSSGKTKADSRKVVKVTHNNTIGTTQYSLEVPQQQPLKKQKDTVPIEQISENRENLLIEASADKKMAVASLINALDREETADVITAVHDFRQAVLRENMAANKLSVGLGDIADEFTEALGALGELTGTPDGLEKESSYIDKLKAGLNVFLKADFIDDAGLHRSASAALSLSLLLLEAYSPDSSEKDAGKKEEAPEETILRDCFNALYQLRTEFEDASQKYMEALLNHDQLGLLEGLTRLLGDVEKSILLRGVVPTDENILRAMDINLQNIDMSARLWTMGGKPSDLNLPALHGINKQHLEKLPDKSEDTLPARATEKVIEILAEQININLFHQS